MTSKHIGIIVAVVALAISVVPVSPAVAAPSISKHDYIVVFQDTVSNSDQVSEELNGKHKGELKHLYNTALKGFASNLPDKEVESLKKDSRVKFVSADQEVHATAQTLPTGINRTDAELNTTATGAGITLAVIDTGISTSHPDLAGKVVAQKNCIRSNKPADDDNGHGSHVAGTIAATNNTIGVVGMAPQVKLAAVKVLNAQGSGSWSSVICGIDWVAQNASKYNIKVANMSLGGGGTSDNACGNNNFDALHQSICRSTAAGVTFVVAAGNDGKDANGFVPASYNDAVITVSALADSDGKPGGLGAATTYGKDDTFASFSNYGSAVDIAAPGVNIYSTWKSAGYNTISGTSMATPHVAGAAALYLQIHPGSNWTQVKNGLVSAAEVLGSGHTDPSGLHPEPVLKAQAL